VIARVILVSTVSIVSWNTAMLVISVSVRVTVILVMESEKVVMAAEVRSFSIRMKNSSNLRRNIAPVISSPPSLEMLPELDSVVSKVFTSVIVFSFTVKD
jgi:hypothetical protein